MKKILVWICILAFAGIVDTCYYVIKSSSALESQHNVVLSSPANGTSNTQTKSTSDKSTSLLGSLIGSSSGPSHSTLVKENAAYNLSSTEMQLYNNTNTFSAAATKLYNKIEGNIYNSYYVNQLDYRTVVNLNNFVTYDGIRYYKVYNYYITPTEGTIANPVGISSPNGTIYNFAGLDSTFYICATGQTMTDSDAENKGNENPLNSNLTSAQIQNQLEKIAIEYNAGATTSPGVTVQPYMQYSTEVNGVTYYQVVLNCPSGNHSQFHVRGSETQASFYMEPNGRIWQTKNQAFLYGGYFYDGIHFGKINYYQNAFDSNWQKNHF